MWIFCRHVIRERRLFTWNLHFFYFPPNLEVEAEAMTAVCGTLKTWDVTSCLRVWGEALHEARLSSQEMN